MSHKIRLAHKFSLALGVCAHMRLLALRIVCLHVCLQVVGALKELATLDAMTFRRCAGSVTSLNMIIDAQSTVRPKGRVIIEVWLLVVVRRLAVFAILRFRRSRHWR